MNDKRGPEPEGYHAILLLSELEEGRPISQREMAGRLGIALGLVNAYVKTLVHKGFLQVKAFPRNRYAYLLTPSGFSEKSRLAYQQVVYFHSLFRTARKDSLVLFTQLRAQGVTALAFCGVDEFTEIAYLSLCDAGLELTAVFDNRPEETTFLGRSVQPLSKAATYSAVPIVITALRQVEDYRSKLVSAGVETHRIYGPLFGEANPNEAHNS